MGKYDFDSVIDRRGSGAVKTDRLAALYGRDDIMALWIADMDFAVCPEIIDAVRRRLEHPFFGYSWAPDSYWNSIIDWERRRHGVEFTRDDLTFVPGVVKGVSYAVNFFTREGDGVIIQPPVYHPFRITIEGNRRRLLQNPLIATSSGYAMDFAHLERLIAQEHPKLMVLCNPHNPGGIAWDIDTLQRLARLCKDNGIIVVSDEIHSDLMLWGHRHLPFVSVSPDAEAITITLGAPSKTFNIPGFVSSWIAIRNPELRREFYEWMEANQFSEPTLAATIAAEAAYTKGEQGLDELIPYVQDTIMAVERFVGDCLPGVRVIRPDASFLLWLDFRSLGLPQQKLVDIMVSDAGLALNDGTMYGTQGEGFLRLNIASPRSVIMEAMERMRRALVPYLEPACRV